MAGMIRVEVTAIAVDARSQPVILLRPVESERALVLPIWIGAQEATSIAIAVHGEVAPRPLSHDLMLGLLDAVGAKLDRVEIVRLEGGTYFAEAHVSTGNGGVILDARPSDALALASRCAAQVWVAESVFDEAGVPAAILADEEAEVSEFKRFLDDVDPDDFAG